MAAGMFHRQLTPAEGPGSVLVQWRDFFNACLVELHETGHNFAHARYIAVAMPDFELYEATVALTMMFTPADSMAGPYKVGLMFKGILVQAHPIGTPGTLYLVWYD